ncbi:MAG: hypothetical protein NZ602_11845 [Thermoguttaceae bacterium]|nr:hypothetical protein [Thermoguttaceae bacterium]MDW8039280.1 hypothetical protein [Thermoguttaceae bacterium]
MRAVGIGLITVGILAILLPQTPSEAAPPSSVGTWVASTGVAHPPGPPGPGRYWRPLPPPPPPCVVLPPPPPPPPRRVYYLYPPVVYEYTFPGYFYDYPYSRGTFYYSTPRTGIIIRW